MKKYITISREFGSGGRVIGKKIADNLGYDFYDREIIDMAAEESGLSAEFIEKTEQNISSGWLYNLLLGTSYAGTTSSGGQHIGIQGLPLADQVFNAERKIIQGLTKKPCVVVGRCADYIFRTSEEIDKNDLLNLFIYADMEDKVKIVSERLGIGDKEAKKMVRQIDRRRANHYSTFTEDTWGDRKNYDLMVNSSTLGIEQTVEMLTAYIRRT